jgi:opacity protein-like surface antigen
MRRMWLERFLLIAGMVAVGGAGAARAQTDVALSLYGAFTGTTNANGTVQSPSASAGGMVELRHIRNPLIGYEATYSYNRADQRYTPSVATGTCAVGVPPPCPGSTTVEASAHEITADWVASLRIANLKPFALVGLGVLFNQPSSGQNNTTSDTKAVYLYGAGLDLGLIPHLGLRFQYRGNLYKAPNLSQLFTSTDRFTHTAEPMIGAYFRF